MSRPLRSPRALAWLLVLGAALLGAAASAALQPPLGTPALRELLAKHPGEVFLLDVRTPGEWASGRLPGSVLIPMNEVPARIAEIPSGKKVVVVCASGARSAAVARFLDQRGYPWVANYAGGVFEWSRMGLPLVR